VVLAVATFAAGCMGSGDHDGTGATTGSGADAGSGASNGSGVAGDRAHIHIPLTQAAAGELFQLNANFQVTESDGTVLVVDGSGNESSLSIDVPPGITQVQVLDGWTLSRSTDGGVTFVQVPAVLASMNPENLLLEPNQVSFSTFQFIVRNPDATLEITIGVDDEPRQITMEIFVDTAFGDFSAYNGSEVDLSVFFSAGTQTSVETDGTHDLQYFSGESAMQVFTDPHGKLGPIQRAFTGGFLQITNRAHPDATQDLTASYTGFSGNTFVDLELATGQAFFSLDPDGFPADGFFEGFSMPFSLSQNGVLLMAGHVGFLDGQPPTRTPDPTP
jgi:hypothetical protein